MYRSTNNNTDYSSSMCDAISSIARKFPNSPLWITGVINLPDVQWKTNTVTKHQYTKQINEHFLDTFSMLGLSQMVTFPTRRDNTLDVFLTNRPSLVNSCEPVPGISDHDAAVYVHSDILPKRHRPIQRTIHIWRKTDNRLIHDELATFADELQKDHNLETPVETLWALFVARCKQVLAKHVPTKLSSRRYNQPWANGKNRNLSRTKKKYFKKAQRTKCAHDQTKYRELKKLAQSECTKAYYENINSMLDENNQNEINLKKFWSFIKSKKKETSGVAALMKDGTVHSDSQAIWCVLCPEKNTKSVENVQRQAASFVKSDYRRRSSVTTMLESLNWVSVASRRAEAKFVMLYRITNNLVDVTTSALTSAPTRTRGNTHL